MSKTSRFFTRTFCIALVTLLHSIAFCQQDIYVNGKGPSIVIGTSLIWGSSGRGAINNNFIFSPSSLQANVCIYITNNNPTSGHTFTVQVFQSGDPSLRSYSGNATRFVKTQALNSITLSASQSVSIFANIGTASTASINISGSTTQAGNPDTADVYALQTTGSTCSSASTTAQLTQIQAISYSGTSNGYTATACAVNPALNQPIVALLAPSNGSIHNVVFYEKVRFSSTVAAQININRITDIGTTCTVGVQTVMTNLLPVAVGGQFLAGTCAAVPTIGGNISSELIGISNPVEVDLRGFYFPLNSGTTRGIEVAPSAAVTGTICATLYWSEQ